MKTETKRHLIKSLINKFTYIPSKKWCERHLSYRGRHCALGHLGVTDKVFDAPANVEAYPPLARGMIGLFNNQDEITAINDDERSQYDQGCPRARILAALHDKLKECL